MRPWPDLGGRRIVFVGRLVRQKGVHTLVRAMEHLRARDATVLLAGDGPERDSLQRSAAASGSGSRLKIMGFMAHEEVPAVLAHADVLVLPSVYEELGSIVVEALHSGVPVVASRTGGIPDAIVDGDNGLLVPPEDPVALAAAIDRILEDEHLARRLSAAAHRRAARYDWNVLAANVLDVYREAIGRGHARPAHLRAAS